MAHNLNLVDSGMHTSVEDPVVVGSAGGTSHEKLPPLLRHISSETSLVFDSYDNDIENPLPAASKQSSEAPPKLSSPVRNFDGAAAIPSELKDSYPSCSPRSSVFSKSHSSHIISISMPSSPVKIQMQQAKVVFFEGHKVGEQTQGTRLQNSANGSFSLTTMKPRHKVGEQTEGTRLQNSANGSFSLTAMKPQKQAKFYSQPIATEETYDKVMPNGTSSDISSGERCDGGNRTTGNHYAYFKTRSGKLDRQISCLRGKQLEGYNEAVHLADCEIETLPAGRYFDALQGPELEILRDSEELVLPKDKQWPFLLRFPISCFGICLGIGSQAMLWKQLAATPSMGFLHVPETINFILWCVALMALLTIVVVYLSKCIFYFEAVRREYYHPVRVNFFFAPWIGGMFLALALPPSMAKSIHPVVWCVLMTPVLCLELKIYGQWMSGGQRRLSKVANPLNHLSIVGNFVGALLGATTGWKEAAIFFFAVGLAHYIVLFVTLYQRLPTNEALPPELHPVFFLFVAAPSVASVAWEKIQGDFDDVSRVAYFIALFLYSSLVVRINFFRGFRFSIAWWAYTFPMTGAAVATIKYSNKVRNPFTQTLAVILSIVSSLTVLGLFVSTILHAFVWGTLFPNDIAIAIMNKNERTKKRNKKAAGKVQDGTFCK